VLSETRREELANRFRRESDAYYVEAKRSLVSSIAQIPYWMYGVLAVLGWNEFVAVLRSPVYFTLVLVALATTYVILQLGLVSLKTAAPPNGTGKLNV
jgi:ABC-type oligopeptide transport system substrate-binding subunit